MKTNVDKFLRMSKTIVMALLWLSVGVALFIEYKIGGNLADSFMSWFGGAIVILFGAIVLGAVSLTFPKQLFKSNSKSFFYNKGPFLVLLGLCLFVLNTAYSFNFFINAGSVLIGVFLVFNGSGRTARYIQDRIDVRTKKQ